MREESWATQRWPSGPWPDWRPGNEDGWPGKLPVAYSGHRATLDEFVDRARQWRTESRPTGTVFVVPDVEAVEAITGHAGPLPIVASIDPYPLAQRVEQLPWMLRELADVGALLIGESQQWLDNVARCWVRVRTKPATQLIATTVGEWSKSERFGLELHAVLAGGR